MVNFVHDPAFLNPLNNPIFYPLLARFVGTFLAGFILIWILNKFKLKDIWQGNLGKRYISWLVIGFLFMLFILLGGYPALGFLLVFMILALWEVGKMAKLPKMYYWALYVLAFAGIGVTVFFIDKFYILPIMFFAVLTTLTVRRNDTKGFFYLATSLYASIWIIFFLCHFILLGYLNNGLDNTKSLLFMIGFAVPLADIGAYVIGKQMAKIKFLSEYKIASNISPNKIWAGILGNIAGAGIGIWIMSFAIKNYFSLTQMIILAVIIGVFSAIGDMNESLVKRYFNRKDSSDLIPGHGGILDRIDSVMRVIVVVYYFMLIVLA